MVTALGHPCRDEQARSQGPVIARNSRLPHFTAIRDTLTGNPWMPQSRAQPEPRPNPSHNAARR